MFCAALCNLSIEYGIKIFEKKQVLPFHLRTRAGTQVTRSFKMAAFTFRHLTVMTVSISIKFVLKMTFLVYQRNI